MERCGYGLNLTEKCSCQPETVVQSVNVTPKLMLNWSLRIQCVLVNVEITITVIHPVAVGKVGKFSVSP